MAKLNLVEVDDPPELIFPEPATQAALQRLEKRVEALEAKIAHQGDDTTEN